MGHRAILRVRRYQKFRNFFPVGAGASAGCVRVTCGQTRPDRHDVSFHDRTWSTCSVLCTWWSAVCSKNDLCVSAVCALPAPLARSSAPNPRLAPFHTAHVHTTCRLCACAPVRVVRASPHFQKFLLRGDM
eukprot:7007353-Prymnesium_polylepis.1